MTNRERILKITADDKNKRIEKILSCIHKNYTLQTARPDDVRFPTSEGIVNIIIPAKKQKNKIAIVAHHDVFPGSKGYNDNSTGVVTLLKLQDVVPENVELVFTDGEERGGQGCRYYLENYPNPTEAINVDVVGLGDRVFYEAYGDVTAFDIPKSLELYANIPFSDSRVLADYGVPNILVLTGKSKETLIRNIFEAQHGGRNDHNLSLISEEMMNTVFDAVVQMIQ